jgi:L-threonylcarbamoyladenylate synthase
VTAHPAQLVTTDPARAAEALRAGHLAVLPTETVYGLGARAIDPGAVARVYAVKGRPADHPLIVHLPGVQAVPDWAGAVPAYARRLAEALWPGPLTLVLPRGGRAGLHVTGGQATVGLRVPDHPLTRAVLAALDDGVAAPSANLFGRVSPTTAAHVVDEIGARLVPGHDVVLDGGPCRVGVESTIVDATGPAPRILRPGGVSAEQVVQIGGVAIDRTEGRVRAPGTLESHYAPSATVVVVETADLAGEALAGEALAGERPSIGLLAPAKVPTPQGLVRLAAPESAAAFAAGLYSALREADALGLTRVLAVPPSSGALVDAVRDRLRRSAAGSS